MTSGSWPKVGVHFCVATSRLSKACGRPPSVRSGCCARRWMARRCSSASPSSASSCGCLRSRGCPGDASFRDPTWRTSWCAMGWDRQAGVTASQTLVQRRSRRRRRRTTRKGRPSSAVRMRSKKRPSSLSSDTVPRTLQIEDEQSAWVPSGLLLTLSCECLRDLQSTRVLLVRRISKSHTVSLCDARLRRAAHRAELASECSLELRPLFAGEILASISSMCFEAIIIPAASRLCNAMT